MRKTINIYERFEFFPRAESRAFRCSANTWLVCYDNEKKCYVKEEGTRAMKRFNSSVEGYKWLVENYEKEPKPLKTFYVDVHSDGWGTTVIYKVEATSEKEAIEFAQENFGDLNFHYDIISEEEANKTSSECNIEIEEL